MPTILAMLLASLLAGPGPALERVLVDHGWGRPVRDVALDVVADRLSERLGGPVEGPVPTTAAEQLRFLLAQGGVSDGLVFPYTVRHRTNAELPGLLPRALTQLERQHAPTHYGVATRGRPGAWTTTVLLVHRGLELDAPLPLRAAPGDVLSIRGRLRRGYFTPRLVVAGPDGAIHEHPTRNEGRRIELSLLLGAGKGVYGVELIADSRHGPVVLHNHQVYAGVEPPDAPLVQLVPAPTDAPDRALFALINDQRERRGLPPLRWHEVLAEVAQAHAQDMEARRTLVHVTPDGGPLSARLQARGLRPTRIAENLAFANSAQAALRALIESPGHRRNLLLPELTHIGVGVSGQYYAIALSRLEP